MTSIKNVAVLGGSGNLGPTVIAALVAAGFTVTALTRESSSSSNNPASKFPSGVAVKSVDYTSLDALTAAFQGQDAVVSVVGAPGVPGQKTAVDAAIAAGVRRFIPSEFGINTRKVVGTPIGKILAGKIGVVDYLQEKAKQHEGFTWTGLSTGLFFDYGLERFGLGIVNLKDKTATVIDSGNEKWYGSNLPHIGKVVAGILKHPDQTANQYLSTASFNVSTNELIALVEELTGSKLAITNVKSEDLQKEGEEKLAKGDFSAFVTLLRVHNSKDGAGNGLPDTESANQVVGVPYEDLRATVESWLKKEGAL